jgi:hypothetical protein
VWFGLLALLHTILILNGWARWSALKFLGYEYIAELNRTARLEPSSTARETPRTGGVGRRLRGFCLLSPTASPPLQRFLFLTV